MNLFYSEKTNTQSVFTKTNIGFLARSITLVAASKSSEDIQYSFDGQNVAGDISIGEPLNESITFTEIWIKSASGGQEYRLWASSKP